MEGEISISSSITYHHSLYWNAPSSLVEMCKSACIYFYYHSITCPCSLNPWRDSRVRQGIRGIFPKDFIFIPSKFRCDLSIGALGLECGPSSYTSCQVSWQLIEKLDLFQGICQQQLFNYCVKGDKRVARIVINRRIKSEGGELLYSAPNWNTI